MRSPNTDLRNLTNNIFQGVVELMGLGLGIHLDRTRMVEALDRHTGAVLAAIPNRLGVTRNLCWL